MVPVLFKIYLELERNSLRLRGKKDSEVIPDTGFVYIFRELRPGETPNDDGSRVRRWTIVDLSKSNGSVIPAEQFRESSNYFFTYSRNALTEARQDTILKEIQKKINWIGLKKNPSVMNEPDYAQAEAESNPYYFRAQYSICSNPWKEPV